MNKLEEKLFAPRRLLDEQRNAQMREARAKRNPEKMKRIMPVRTMKRLRDG
jgi:hypothetical protein